MSTRGTSQAATATMALLGTAVAYLSWLGWDQARDVHPDGSSTGPYQAWQVVGLAVTVGGLAWASAWRRMSVVGCLLITLSLTLCWSVDAATDTDADGLWMIGAAFVLIGTAGGTSLLAFLATWVMRRRGHRVRTGDDE